jgi:hypothetical protein
MIKTTYTCQGEAVNAYADAELAAKKMVARVKVKDFMMIVMVWKVLR